MLSKHRGLLICAAFLYIVLMCSVCHVSGQVTSTDFIYNGKVDSVALSVYDCKTKETSGLFDKEEDKFELIRSVRLQDGDIAKLTAALRNKRSFVRKRALLNHCDIVIDYFLKDSIIQSANISSLTHNITIIRNGCEPQMPGDKGPATNNDDLKQVDDPVDIVDPCFFGFQMSHRFEKYLGRLMKKYGVNVPW